MILEQVPIMTADQYFERYGRNGIGKGADREMVKKQLIDAFEKEIFGLLAMRLKLKKGESPKDNPDAQRVLHNIMKDENRKWVKLCQMFAMYKETAGLLNPMDLMNHEGRLEENEANDTRAENTANNGTTV